MANPQCPQCGAFHAPPAPPDPIARLIGFAENQNARINAETTDGDFAVPPTGEDWDSLYQEVIALKGAASLALPARGVQRLTADQFTTLTCALTCAADKYRGNAVELLEFIGDSRVKPTLTRLADQFDRQAKEALALYGLLSDADVVEVIL